MNQQTTDSFQGVINDLLLSVPREITLSGGNLEVDYGLIDKGIIVTDNYFSVITDGTVHVASEKEYEHPERNLYTLMPVHVPEAEEIQILISEYSLNRILDSVVELDMIYYVNSEQTSVNVDAIINEYEEVFGVHPNVTIIVKANPDLNKYLPQVKLSHHGSLIEFYMDVHFTNPLDVSIDAAVMTIKIIANLTFTVDNDFKLYGEAKYLKNEIIEFSPYFKSTMSKSKIEKEFQMYTPLMESYINSILDDGWQLPIPKNITKYILKEKVTAYNGYLLIDGDADFT